jgi:hypothetical protein
MSHGKKTKEVASIKQLKSGKSYYSRTEAWQEYKSSNSLVAW